MKTLFILTTGISMIDKGRDKRKDFASYPFLSNPYTGKMTNFESIESHFSKEFNTDPWQPSYEVDPSQTILDRAGAELRLLYFCRQKGLMPPDSENDILFIAFKRDEDQAVVAALKGAIQCLCNKKLLPSMNCQEILLDISEKDATSFTQGLTELGKKMDDFPFTAYNSVYYAILGGMKGLLVYLAMNYLLVKAAFQRCRLDPTRFKGIPYLFEQSNELILIEEDKGAIRVVTVPDQPVTVHYPVRPSS
ncbi:MAG: hypothetical protein PHW74_11635 [Desulfobacca sp.]|nr:hypothetical protein [Desulfobacca sp.]